MLRNRFHMLMTLRYGFLNEVLSLNAQESLFAAPNRRTAPLLNEVLSLNAQESNIPPFKLALAGSSMKS